MLNTFSYTGGFSLAALAGGAAEVCSVDVSARAMELLDKNLALNELQSPNHTSIVADVPAFLKDQQKGHYDLIILDPPAFAKSIHKRHNAIKAYTRLNQAALQLIDQKGLLFTFSCSQVVTEELFYGAASAAAMEVGRNVRLWPDWVRDPTTLSIFSSRRALSQRFVVIRRVGFVLKNLDMSHLN